MGRDVFLVQNKSDLQEYLNVHTPAYIQAYLPIDRDIRVVVINGKIVHAYWRVAAPGEFRSNVAMGAKVVLDPVPDRALDLALHGVDVLVVLDTSGSMGGTSIIQAREALTLALGQLASGDFFNIIEFDSNFTRLHRHSVPAMPISATH